MPADLRDIAIRALDAFDRLPADPCGTTYGHFDGHGWNMAFNIQKSRLKGIYDFADSGFGPLHQEFVYPSFVSPDLTDRIVTVDESLTQRLLDRGRTALITGVHHLHELAEMGNDPEWGPHVLRYFELWARGRTE